MIVCVCNNVNDKEIVNTLKANSIISIEELQENINVCDQCQKCSCQIEEIIYEYHGEANRNEVQDLVHSVDDIFQEVSFKKSEGVRISEL